MREKAGNPILRCGEDDHKIELREPGSIDEREEAEDEITGQYQVSGKGKGRNAG